MAESKQSKIKCPYCYSEDTFEYYMVKMPEILSACKKELAEESSVVEIKVSFCNACALGFQTTKHTFLPKLYTDYHYISPHLGIGTSKYLGMIEDVTKFARKEEKILEIGCSDGYLLSQLKKKGYKNLIGIEPSQKAEFAKDKFKLNIIRDFFSKEFYIKDKVDVVIMMHIWEHFENPFDILVHIRNILNDNGKVIIEIPNFNGYCHQHLFYYTEPFLRRLFYESKFEILKFSIGNYLRIICQKKYTSKTINRKTLKYKLETYKKKAYNMQEGFQLNIRKIEEFLRGNDDLVYWWGAGSASVIYLNQIKLKNLKDIVFILDGDKNKIGEFIPRLVLPVNHWSFIKNKNIKKIIIASEFVDEIKKKMSKEGIKPKEVLCVS